MKDKYKHLLNFTANIISLAVEACMFGWVWYMLYIPMLDKANTFFNRGNWAVIGMYVLFVFFSRRYSEDTGSDICGFRILYYPRYWQWFLR